MRTRRIFARMIVGLAITVATPAHADVGREIAANAIGYAQAVQAAHVCDAHTEAEAASLEADVRAAYDFSQEELRGALRDAVADGRATAEREARHPTAFCASLESVLDLTRDTVLPRR